MEMHKIEKLKDKEVVKVAGQENCRDVLHNRIYTPGQDCQRDCTAANKPKYYLSTCT